MPGMSSEEMASLFHNDNNGSVTVCRAPSPSPMSYPPVPSCLRSNRKGGMVRNVSFPEDDNHIVTGILEPESPWKSVSNMTVDDLVEYYVRSCRKHDTCPLPMIMEQLKNFDLKMERNGCFSLCGIKLDPDICESLEEIFKRVQFRHINLESTCLNDETSVTLFDMLEYYESATSLNISCNPDINIRGWQACSRLIKKTCCLEELDARSTTLNETHMPILSRALKVGNYLQVLKLEKCNLSGRPLIDLVSAMKANTNLKELYLSENNLGATDACQLSSMLRSNVTLQLLDISHNNITDVGMNAIMDSVLKQCFGLAVLIVWNNRLSRHSANSVSRLLEQFTGLEMLNIGMNPIGDEFLRVIKGPLTTNRNLLKLGMQSTYLSNKAGFMFADILIRNTALQRIDLRENYLEETGLEALCKSMKQNSTLLRLDIDLVMRSETVPGTSQLKYTNLVKDIGNMCHENQKRNEEKQREKDAEEQDQIEELAETYRKLKLSFLNSRKISLTCNSVGFTYSPSDSCDLLEEPKKTGTRLKSPAPSPIPSPVSSPGPTRSRFQVTRVPNDPVLCLPSPMVQNPIEQNQKILIPTNEQKQNPNKTNGNRFKIVVIEPSPELDEKPITNILDHLSLKSVSSPEVDGNSAAKMSDHADLKSNSSPGLDGSPVMVSDQSSLKSSSSPEVYENPVVKISDQSSSKSNSIEITESKETDEKKLKKITETSHSEVSKKELVNKNEYVSISSSVGTSKPVTSTEVVYSDVTVSTTVKVSTSRSNVPIETVDKKISTDKKSTRKFSWVPPVFPPTNVIDTNKIPANLEKLLSLFQNPFSKNPKPQVSNKNETSKDTASEPNKPQASHEKFEQNKIKKEGSSDAHNDPSTNNDQTCADVRFFGPGGNISDPEIPVIGSENKTQEHQGKSEQQKVYCIMNKKSVAEARPVLIDVEKDATDSVDFEEDKSKSVQKSVSSWTENQDPESDFIPDAVVPTISTKNHLIVKHVPSTVSESSDEGFSEDKSSCSLETKLPALDKKFFTKSPESDVPATWPPQKLACSNFLQSPTRSSPNILEATALVLLQGHVSSDLAGIQNMSLTREENAAEQT